VFAPQWRPSWPIGFFGLLTYSYRLAALLLGWFISKDAPSFIAVQMMVATLVLAAIVCLLAFLQTLWSRRKQGVKRPS